jgi:phosphatidylinositol alpha-1,6-mannosyltransferase
MYTEAIVYSSLSATATRFGSIERKIVGLFPELLGVGGIQEVGRQTASALTDIALRHNYSTHFIALNDPLGTQSFEFERRNIHFHGFGRRKVRFVLSAISLARQEASIAIAAHPHLSVPAIWMKMASPHLPYIVMSHGVEVWRVLPSLTRYALSHASLALAPSSDTAQRLVKIQGVANNKIRKLAWPVTPEFLRMAEQPSRLSLPKDFPHGKVILTVGRYSASEQYKGTDALIRAVAQLKSTIPDISLAVVGAGDDLPRLRSLSHDLGVSNSVKFLGGIPREEIAACYAQCDTFALPSTGEGFGLVYLEAMAFAKPVIGVACGGVTDLIQDGVNGLLIPPRNLSRLVEGLGTLLTNITLCRECGLRGAEMVRQRYCFETFESELERILAGCGLDCSPSSQNSSSVLAK